MTNWTCHICGKEAIYNLFGKKYCKDHYIYDGTKGSAKKQEEYEKRFQRSNPGKK